MFAHETGVVYIGPAKYFTSVQTKLWWAVTTKKWLISWIGNADHQASEAGSASGDGPIATALTHAAKFDRVCLLTNYTHERLTVFRNGI